MGVRRTDRVGVAMWRLAGLQRLAGQLGKDRPKVLDDALVAFEELIAHLASAIEQAEEAANRAVVAQKEAEELRQRCQDLYELIPMPFLETDGRGTILALNEPATRLLNLSRQAVIGKPLSLFIATERPAFVARLTQLTASDQVDEWPLQIRPREKQRVWVTATVHVSAVHDDGEILHWLLPLASTAV